MNKKNEPVIVAAARTPVGKAKRGSLATTRPEDMMAAVIQDLLKKVAPLKPEEIDDLVVGCAFPEGEQGMNMSRLIGFRAGLPAGQYQIDLQREREGGDHEVLGGSETRDEPVRAPPQPATALEGELLGSRRFFQGLPASHGRGELLGELAVQLTDGFLGDQVTGQGLAHLIEGDV